MNAPIMQARDRTAQRHGNRRIGMRSPLSLVLAAALLLAATSVEAGVIFVPVGNVYAYPELAPARARFNDPVLINPSFAEVAGDGSLHLATSGLAGEMHLDASELPPGFEIPAGAGAKLPFEQQLELVINLSLGVVEGRSTGRIPLSNGILEFRMDVQGDATCLPRNGRECGQLVVALELRGILSDPWDPASVGVIQTTLLGSLVWDDADLVHWAAMSGNSTLGGNPALINSALEHAGCRGALVPG